MYILRFLAAFVSLLFFLSVTAQENCDTLILHPGRPLEVTVDSIANSKVYCKLCGRQSGRAQVIPLKMVVEIKYHDASKRRAQRDSITLPSVEEVQETALSEIKDTKVPKWILTKKDKKSVQKQFQKGLKLKVVYLMHGRKYRQVAVLDDITSTHLVLKSRDNELIPIPRENIVKIKPRNAMGVAGRVAIGTGLFFGVGAIVLAFFALLTYIITFGQDPSGGGLKEDANQGCTLAIVAMIIGVIALIISNSSWINEPFSDKWEIEKVMQEIEPKKSSNNPEEIGIEQP